MTTALILSGGGARAAYQVGVLKAVADILPGQAYNPFPIICGTSAGAINTMALAGRKGTFDQRIQDVENIWRDLTASRVYKTSALSVLRNTLKIFASLAFTGAGFSQSLALLDNSPLRELLKETINFHDLDETIASNYYRAVAVTAMSYGTGRSITFFQGNHENWHRARRKGIRTGLTLDHVMASSAIPTIFPPVRVGQNFFGDGALRQLKPLSPAIHLGADRLFVVGVSDNRPDAAPAEEALVAPNVAQMMGHMLNSAFIDTIESDLETLRTINTLLAEWPADPDLGPPPSNLKKIEFLSITPSRPINELARQHLHEMPRSVRMFLRFSGAGAGGSGASAASYLLFEHGFCSKLIDLGYQDTWSRRDDVVAFLAPEARDS